MLNSFAPAVIDYEKFSKTAESLQKIADFRIHGQTSILHPNDPLYKEMVNLIATMREFMSQQQKFNEKIEKMLETRKSMDDSQQAFNAFVAERIATCKCKMSETLVMPKIETIDQLDDEHSKPEHHIASHLSLTSDPGPSTSTSISPKLYPSQLDVELLKMTQSTSNTDLPMDSSLTEMFLDGNSYDSSFRGSGSPNSEEKKNRGALKGGPYKCSECDKEFKQKHGLQQHFLTHSIGSFFCDVCGKRYTRQESVNRHKRTSQCIRLRPNSIPVNNKSSQKPQIYQINRAFGGFSQQQQQQPPFL